jgi:hypothetical protein
MSWERSTHNRARGAAVLVQMNDGSMYVAELPHPSEVEFMMEAADLPWGMTPDLRIGHYLSVHIDGSYGGTYRRVSAEEAATWFGQQAKGWEEQPALPAGQLEIGS